MAPSIHPLLDNIMYLILAGAFFFTATGTGLCVIKALRLPVPSPTTRVFFGFPTGTAITGYAVFALASLDLLLPVPIYLLITILCLVAFFGWKEWCRQPGEIGLKPAGKWDSFAALGCSVIVAACLILTLAPETGRDSLIYHLNLPKLFLKNHGFYFVPGNIYANFPLHTEMLYLLGLFIKGDVLAKLVHFSGLLCLSLGIILFARLKMGESAPIYMILLMFISVPTVFHVGHMAYVDVFVALYIFAAVWGFLSWHEGKQRGWLLLSALLAGTAMGCKYTALFLPVLGLFGVLWHHRDPDSDARPLQDLAMYVGVLLLFGAPFYLKNWLATGNPFYPFFYNIFGGRGWEPRQAELFEGFLRFFGMGRAATDFLLLPWNVSINAEMHTPKFDGRVGPGFLLLLPFLAGLRPLPAWLRLSLAYSLLTFFFWATSSQQIRFLIPVFPFMAIAAGYVLLHYREKTLIAVTLGVTFWSSVLLNSFHVYKEFASARPTPVVFGGETRDAYLRRSVSSYAMYDYINRSLPTDASIFLVNMKNMVFLCDRTTYSDTMFESYTMQKILSRSRTPDDIQRALQQMGFTHLLYDELYFLGDKSTLLPEEKVLFGKFKEKHLKLIHQDMVYQLYQLLPA